MAKQAKAPFQEGDIVENPSAPNGFKKVKVEEVWFSEECNGWLFSIKGGSRIISAAKYKK